MNSERARVVSSFTIIKGALIDESYDVFRMWDWGIAKKDNLDKVRNGEILSSTSDNWRRDVAKVLNRRFDPMEHDLPLVQLAKAGCPLDIWRPILLWHMTRDEFLLRDFLANWLYGQHQDGALWVDTPEVANYLGTLHKRKGIEIENAWSEQTTKRVASGLQRMATDFGLLEGHQRRRFSSYHLPEESLMYLLHAMTDQERNVNSMLELPDWHMYLMDAANVERELLRLHQFKRLHYETAGSLGQLQLPCNSAADYVTEVMS